MPYTLIRAALWLSRACALVGLICLMLAPVTAMAQYAPDSFVAPGGSAVVTGGQEVLLRSDPGFEAAVVMSLADGTPVYVLDGPYPAADGSSWYQVDAGGQVGYAPAGHLSGGIAEPAETAALEPDPGAEQGIAEQALAEPAPVAEAAPAEYIAAPGTGAAVTTSDVNLRAAPDGDAAVLGALPPGTAVEVTGDAAAGYVPVLANGVGGWIAADYVQAAPAAADAPVAAFEAEAPATTSEPLAAPAPDLGSLVTSSDVNLRAEPYVEAPVIGSIPAGASLQSAGVAENGFSPVTYNGQFGWLADEYLADGDGTDAAARAQIDPAAVPESPPSQPSGPLIAWPFNGGTWHVIQGYNNGTHTNRSSFAQYQYSLDWAREDGNTAGQPVYAPASGTVRWIDRGSGGMLIDMGNGYGVAVFHATIDYGLSRGQAVQQGQQVGTISGPGGEGYMSTAHLDITLWQLTDGGHVATPFTGQFAIGGTEFPDNGGTNQHMGARITP